MPIWQFMDECFKSGAFVVQELPGPHSPVKNPYTLFSGDEESCRLAGQAPAMAALLILACRSETINQVKFQLEARALLKAAGIDLWEFSPPKTRV